MQMKKTLLIAALAVAAISQAQVAPPTSLETVTAFSGGSLKSPHVSQVVTQRVGILHDIFGIKGSYLDWRVFGGFDITAHNAPAAGTTLAGYFKIAREVTLGIGPVVEFSQQQKPLLGAYVGLRFNFGK